MSDVETVDLLSYCLQLQPLKLNQNLSVSSWYPVTIRPVVVSGPKRRIQEEEERGGSVDRCDGKTLSL